MIIHFPEALVTQLVREYYGLDVTAKPLTGEYEFNYLLTAGDGTRYIFKAGSDEHPYHFFDAQVKIQQHLLNSEVADKFSRYIQSLDGNWITVYQNDGHNYYLRLLTFLEGEFSINLQEKPAVLHSQAWWTTNLLQSQAQGV